MKIYENAAAASDILKRGRFDDEEKAAAVKEIVRAVRERGDAALFEYCEKFDGTVLDRDTVAVSRAEIDEAYQALDKELLDSMQRAAENVLAYHRRTPRATPSARWSGRASTSPAARRRCSAR